MNENLQSAPGLGLYKGARNQHHLQLLTLLVLMVVASILPGLAGAQDRHTWVGSWATAPFAHTGQQDPSFAGMTLRQVVHASLTGSALRIRFTNEFGIEPLQIDSAQVAISAGNCAIQPQTDRKITFNGKPSISIPPGSIALSDVVVLPVPTFVDLAISVYLPIQQISIATFHGQADQTNYLQKGNVVSTVMCDTPSEVRSWYFLKGVDVEAEGSASAAIVSFGDSITDGVGSTLDENQRWPDVLARRIHVDPKIANIAVLNEGIGGNRLLRDGTGPSALARFDRDVLTQSGVKYVIVLEGINDIGRLARNNDPMDSVSADDIELALQQLAARAHDHNIKIIAATITPYKGAGYYTEIGEAIREAVNQWIRTSDMFDGVADFDKAVRDPANPLALLPAFDSHDHLHPNDAGYGEMGNAINMALFH